MYQKPEVLVLGSARELIQGCKDGPTELADVEAMQPCVDD
jgi:hypothetical protein